MSYDNCLDFSRSLLGIKYRWWKEGDSDDLFYCNGIPSIEILNRDGINCAGFVNILRQYSGLSIPESNVYRGGTRFWYNYFSENTKLNKFDPEESYPNGTLLLRDYRNIEDQGHLSVIIDANLTDTLEGTIIHAYADLDVGEVGLTKLRYSHYYIDSGYYEYAILPEDWLSSN